LDDLACSTARPYPAALVRALGVDILRQNADAGDREAQWSLAGGMIIEIIENEHTTDVNALLPLLPLLLLPLLPLLPLLLPLFSLLLLLLPPSFSTGPSERSP